MELSSEQKNALNILNGTNNCFITGYAGTGKSTLVRQYVEQYKGNIMRCAPTATAAQLVGGVTLHSAFGIPVELFSPEDFSRTNKIHERIAATSCIIIDEISMVRRDIFDYIINTLRYVKYTGKLIVVGDFFQLPPVLTQKDEKAFYELWGEDEPFAFLSKKWGEMNFVTICLSTVYRQTDTVFLDNLKKIQIGDASALSYFNELEKTDSNKTIAICPRNKQAEKINKSAIGKLKGKPHIFEGILSGNFSPKDVPVPIDLQLKKNSRVVSVVNKYDDNHTLICRNGKQGTIIGFEDNAVKIKWDEDNSESELGAYEWVQYNYIVINENGKKRLKTEIVGTYTQIPLLPAYAITVHKSQGKTLDIATVHSGMFAHGQLYTALSRVKTPDGLSIAGKLTDDDVFVSKTVIDFMKNVSDRQQTQSMPPTEKPATDSFVTKQEPKKIKTGRKQKYGSETVVMRVPKIFREKVDAYIKELIAAAV